MGYIVVLRAIAEKLIPGLPYTTRVSILQQTSTEHRDLIRSDNDIDTGQLDDLSPKKTVLQKVVESDNSRNETLREIAGKLGTEKHKLKEMPSKSDQITRIVTVLSVDADSSHDSWANVQAYRRLQYQRLQRQLLEIEKLASLRSGARGYQVRKELVAFERKVAKSKEMYTVLGSILFHYVVYADIRP